MTNTRCLEFHQTQVGIKFMFTIVSSAMAAIFLMSSSLLLGSSSSATPKPEDLSEPSYREGPASSVPQVDAFKNLKSFAIYPVSVYPPSLRKNIELLVVDKLSKVGNVITLEVPDFTGFINSQAHLCLSISDVYSMDEKPLSISETIFFLNVIAVIRKTGIECMTRSWSSCNFFNGKVEEKNQANILRSVQFALEAFLYSYRSANPETIEKLTFYFYH